MSCTKIAIWNNFFYPELFHFFDYFSFKINKLLILEQLELLEQRFLCIYVFFNLEALQNEQRNFIFVLLCKCYFMVVQFDRLEEFED